MVPFLKFKLFRSFKPDFVFIQQNLRNATENHKNLLLGFQFGGKAIVIQPFDLSDLISNLVRGSQSKQPLICLQFPG